MRWLAPFCEAAYLLARFHEPQLEGWVRGRVWENWAAATLRLHTWASQGPGTLNLFGCESASGFRHELDGAGHRDGWTIISEAKAYMNASPTKADVCLFDRKTFDLYVSRRRTGESGPHWRVLMSATTLDDDVRRYCYLYGIVAIEPTRLPLPMLLRIAARPLADDFFDDQELAELVRLGEQAIGPMECRYKPEANYLRFDIGMLKPQALDDLLWLQDILTKETLELADQGSPGFYENRADELLRSIGVPTDNGVRLKDACPRLGARDC